MLHPEHTLKTQQYQIIKGKFIMTHNSFFKTVTQQLGACILVLPLAIPAMAAGRVVNCKIDNSGVPSFKGKCLFLPEKGGSFSLQNTKRDQPIMDGLLDVHVYIVEKGVAEVSSVTVNGINSRWGEATRSSTEKACWVGNGFKVCAW